MKIIRPTLILTCKCNIKAPVCVGVVSQELQSCHMGTSSYGRGKGVTGEGTEDGRLSLTKIEKDF